MRLALDIILIFIIVYCTWYGYKYGVIRSILGLAVIIISLVFANLIGTTVAKQIVPAVEPFVDGYVDSEAVTTRVMESLGYKDSDKSLGDVLAEDTSLRYDYAYECLREIGFFKAVSEDLAQDAVNYADKNNLSMTDAVVTVACNCVAYVLSTSVAFVMIAILLGAFINLLNLNIRLPNAVFLDEAAGALVGFIKGFLICILICWLLGFMGLIIGKDTSEKGLMSFFLAFRFITRALI